MSALTETAAELLLHRRAFIPAMPGLVGARIGVAGTARLADGRLRLRHGHLNIVAGRATLSVPPSPGVDIAFQRAAQDLVAAREIVQSDAGQRATTSTFTTGVRIILDAGVAGRGPFGYRHRWSLAHALGPVLHAVFGAPTTTVPPSPGPEPRTAWAACVLDAAIPDGRTFRAWTRSADRPTMSDLDAHIEALTVPVHAHGQLGIDAAGELPGDAWVAALAVTAVLLDDPQAAAEAAAATWLLTRPGVPSPWVRAARARLADDELATAARECLFAAYRALARHGGSRDVRDAVAAIADAVPRRAAAPCRARVTPDRATAVRETPPRNRHRL
jgi:glutamate--cysteine ligase